jgi:D-glycero-beta-D-manno-heptose 1-phosphate adenylyltransferase
MRKTDILQQKILTREQLGPRLLQWKFIGKKIAFTNGCFDILHKGHIASLSAAAREADLLIVGVNSDASTKRLKGPLRPINDEQSRAELLAALFMVDAVVIFEEDTPKELIEEVSPDVLVKGGDYTIDQIVGAQQVISNGGRVVVNPIVEGYSTTGVIEKISKL